MNHPLSTNRRLFMQGSALALAGTFLTGRSPAATASGATLPALPYPTDALAPHIDARTMEIHHGKHHAAYVKGLNEALAAAPALAGKPLPTLLADLPGVADEKVRTALRNHGGGHWNHSLFWSIMAPAAKSGAPSPDLTAAINAAFGSLDAMKTAVNEAGMKRFGSGWTWLVLRDGKLAVTSTPNQDNPLMKGIVPDASLGTPILGNDVWEHAYYLNYQNRRADYLTAWWNVVDWNAVSLRFAESARP
jgi:Fe-Mn family superoxide dismutase